MWIRCVIGLRNGPSTWPPSWQMSHIILSSSSTTMKSSKTSFSSARKSSSRSLSASPWPAHPEGPGDRVHPYVARADRDVALRAGADQEPLAGEEAEGPVGAALALHQPPQHRQRLRGVPVGDDGAVVAADDEVGALALADLVADDRLDDLAVVLVAGVEPAPVGELDRHVGQRLEQVVDRHLVLGLDVDDRQRGAVVDGARSRARAPAGTARRPAGRRSGPAPGAPLSSGMSSRLATSCGVPPIRPAVGDALRRMTAHAPYPWICSRRSRTGGVWVMAETLR